MADFTVLILCLSAFLIFDYSLGMPSRKARLKVRKNCDLPKPRSLFLCFCMRINNDVDKTVVLDLSLFKLPVQTE